MLDWLTQADHAIFFVINEMAGHSAVQSAAVFLSDLGRYPVFLLALVALALAGWPRFRLHLLALVLVMPVAYGVNYGLKESYGRYRPMRYFEDQIKAERVLIHGDVWIARKSFPSGHTTFAFFSLGYLALARRRLAGPALALAFLIAWSRIATGAHFPFDCLAGMALGSLWALLAWRVHHYLESRAWTNRKEPMAEPGRISGPC